MDHQSFEQRVANLEARFEPTTHRLNETPSLRERVLPKLRLEVERLEARLKELDDVEKIAFAAYEQTHPAAKAGVDEMNNAVETARQRVVKDHERKSKS